MDTQVLLVEDQDSTRIRIATALQQHPEITVCGSVATVKEAHKALDSLQPRVLLTDLDLPDGNGLELIQRVATQPDIEAIVVTVFGDEEHVVNAIQAGAMGYLLKDSSTEDIGNSVIEMLNGGAPISPGIARFLLQRVRTNKAPVKSVSNANKADLPHLTKREQEVLQLIAKGFSYAEIAKMLSISFHTVTSHIKHIYKKLAVGSRGEAVYEAIQLGILNPEG